MLQASNMPLAYIMLLVLFFAKRAIVNVTAVDEANPPAIAVINVPRCSPNNCVNK